MTNKILSLNELTEKCKQLRRENCRIVLCHGCFDLLHIGHVRHFKAAKRLGDVLIVSITSNRFVNKGHLQPLFDQSLRMEFVASLEVVDYVTLSDNPSAVEVIRQLKPNIFAKGSDYKIRDENTNPNIYLEEQALAEIGGKLVYTEDITFSSTSLLKIIADRAETNKSH